MTRKRSESSHDQTDFSSHSPSLVTFDLTLRVWKNMFVAAAASELSKGETCKGPTSNHWTPFGGSTKFLFIIGALTSYVASPYPANF